jgi:hypothetical protein
MRRSTTEAGYDKRRIGLSRGQPESTAMGKEGSPSSCDRHRTVARVVHAPLTWFDWLPGSPPKELLVGSNTIRDLLITPPSMHSPVLD